MPKFRIVCLSNALPPDSEVSAFSATTFSTLENLARSRDWKRYGFCGKAKTEILSETVFPILSRMSGDSFDLKLWHGYRMLSAHALATAKKAAAIARHGDLLFVLNPTGLSTLEWTFALTQAQNIIPWVDSDWACDFPKCDPFWTLARQHRHSLNPATLIASALIRSLYGELCLTADVFCGVRSAVFATESLRERNASAFQNLEHSAVIAPAVDPELFPFLETSPRRSRVWGWNGGLSESSGVFLVVDAFARQAFSDPQMSLLIAGDENSPEAAPLLGRIASVSGLDSRIVFTGAILRERLAQDFFHQIGLYAFIPKDESAFPLEAAEAMACGCLVFASFTEEMRALASAEIPLLFNREVPETAFLGSDLITHLSQEEWALIAADCATRIQERCSPARIELALAEFIERSAACSQGSREE